MCCSNIYLKLLFDLCPIWEHTSFKKYEASLFKITFLLARRSLVHNCPTDCSCDIPGVLEAEVCQPGTSLGLHGVPGGGGAPKTGLCCQSSVPGEEPDHGRQGALVPPVYSVQEDCGRNWTYTSHGKLLIFRSRTLLL